MTPVYREACDSLRCGLPSRSRDVLRCHQPTGSSRSPQPSPLLPRRLSNGFLLSPPGGPRYCSPDDPAWNFLGVTLSSYRGDFPSGWLYGSPSFLPLDSPWCFPCGFPSRSLVGFPGFEDGPSTRYCAGRARAEPELKRGLARSDAARRPRHPCAGQSRKPERRLGARAERVFAGRGRSSTSSSWTPKAQISIPFSRVGEGR